MPRTRVNNCLSLLTCACAYNKTQDEIKMISIVVRKTHVDGNQKCVCVRLAKVSTRRNDSDVSMRAREVVTWCREKSEMNQSRRGMEEGEERERERTTEKENNRYYLACRRICAYVWRYFVYRERIVHVDVSLIIKRQINPGLWLLKFQEDEDEEEEEKLTNEDERMKRICSYSSRVIKLNVVVLRGDGERLDMKIFDESNRNKPTMSFSFSLVRR